MQVGMRFDHHPIPQILHEMGVLTILTPSKSKLLDHQLLTKEAT